MASTAARELQLVHTEGQELIERARAGDRDAMEALLSQHELLVIRTCRHLLPRGDDVDAAAQETMLRALRKLDSFTGQGSFAAWIATIAVNLCRDRLRRRRLIPFLPLETNEDDDPGPIAVVPSGEPNPERVVMARQAVARLRREFARLPRRQQEVFALRFFSGLELEGIAQALKVDLGTVKTHLFRAVHRVRAAVEEARP